MSPVSADPRSLGLIGAGRLGCSLALALHRVGHTITRVASSSPLTARALAERLPGATHASAEAVVEGSGLVFLTVPDDALAGLVLRLPWRTGQQVVHCSGALGLGVLQAAADVGAERGCLHPLQSFPDRFGDPLRFAGISCGVEADGALWPRLQRLCDELGASVVSLVGVDRARYHAAAVFASNYVVALHTAAAQTWALAGLPAESARAALAPLTLGAANNVQSMPLEAALTGPIVRGDVATVERHLLALEEAPQLQALYRELGRQLLALPLALSSEQRATLYALLERS